MQRQGGGSERLLIEGAYFGDVACLLGAPERHSVTTTMPCVLLKVVLLVVIMT
jgi:hypothetical protein